MKLLVIHGPPAAGKLTVATEVAKYTAFKVFHNHLSIDCVKPVFEFGTPDFWKVIRDVRELVIRNAAQYGVDLIHTFCYEFGADDAAFRQLIEAAESHGGEVHAVLLHCDDETRRQRIANESRVRIGKLTDPASVGRNNIDLTTPLPGLDTLVVDTSAITPAEAARRIIQRYSLDHVPGLAEV